MRQAGAISNESDAQRFAAYLVTQGIDAHAELEQSAWAIWVRDENHLDEAKAELARFQQHPADPRYQDAERSAALRRKEIERERTQAKSHVVEMRGRWGRSASAARRAPLTITLILLSGFVSLTSGAGDTPEPVMSQLTFCWPIMVDAEGQFAPHAGWAQILQGQVWRVFTPMFVHFGLMHLIFNMFVLYYYASQIEDRRGTWRLAIMVFSIAGISNIGQYLWSGNPYFGGMSGVAYGLFGYVWMRMLHDPRSGLFVSPVNVFIMVAWFALCLAGEFGPFTESLKHVVGNVANAAHAVGLVMGVAIGYLPALMGRQNR